MVADQPQDSPQLSVDGDQRITRLGHWLRHTKLDELPQLFNVVRGEMSIVGPRPEVPIYVEQYTAEQRQILNYRPGITDPASIRYRHESRELAAANDAERYYIDVVMPTKLSMNLEYAQGASLISDIGVILDTFRAVFRR